MESAIPMETRVSIARGGNPVSLADEPREIAVILPPEHIGAILPIIKRAWRSLTLQVLIVVPNNHSSDMAKLPFEASLHRQHHLGMKISVCSAENIISYIRESTADTIYSTIDHDYAPSLSKNTDKRVIPLLQSSTLNNN
jgi:hypothetical protein